MSIILRYFGVDCTQRTYGTFLMFLEQLPRVKKYEEGVNPDDKKALSIEDFISSVKAGELALDALKPTIKPLAPDQKAMEEAKIKKLLAMDGEVITEKINLNLPH